MKKILFICFLLTLFYHNKTQCWNLTLEMSFLAKSPVNAITWHKDECLAVAYQNRISVFNKEKGDRAAFSLKDHTKKVNALAWKPELFTENINPSDKTLASGSDDTTIKLMKGYFLLKITCIFLLKNIFLYLKGKGL